MTSDEAIFYLKKLKEEYGCSYEEDAIDEAISAIKVIEAIMTSSTFTNLQKKAISEMLKENKE